MTGGRLVVVHPTAKVLAEAVAARLLTRIIDIQSVRSPVHVVVTGGTIGIRALAAVAHNPVRAAVDWTSVHVWWGDERFLPSGDADRNETQARTALLDSLESLPAANIHAMAPADGTRTAEESADLYAAELARFAPEGAAQPIFDVTLVGMGPDAHVASLFPGHVALGVTGRTTTAVHDSPKLPPDRVSLTFEALQGSAEVWVVASGADKAPAVAAALSGAPLDEAPIGGATGRLLTAWLVDVDAASAIA